ncbi:MAG: class I SAM-dependent methyltransferase [Candidatus Shapirobacteria bacterium]
MKKEDSIKKYDYNKNPQGGDSFFDMILDKRTRRFLKAIDSLKRPKILEIGMGEGRFLKKIAKLKPKAKLFGVDISKTAIKQAKKDSFLKGSFWVADAQKLPFSKSMFDVVVMMDVLEHAVGPLEVILEAKRVLKKQGIFHFYVPCENQPFTVDYFLLKTSFFANVTKKYLGHINHFSQTDVKKLIKNNFQEQAFTYSDHLFSQVLHFFALYLPKMLLEKFGGNGLEKRTRDTHKMNKSAKDQLLFTLKIFWQFFTLPAFILSELEAFILKRASFNAKGLHFTGKGKIVF